MEITWILFAVVITLLSYGYMKMRKKLSVWQNKGVTHPRPLPLFGNTFSIITLKKAQRDIYEEMYNRYPNEKIVGIYELLKPTLIVRDSKLAEKVLIKDFQHFTDHTSTRIGRKTLFTDGLFQLGGKKWRAVRAKVSPAFTSGKLKSMFSDMVTCTDKLISDINKNVNQDYELKHVLGNYSMDVIASTVFGIQIKDEDKRKEFSKMGNSIFEITPYNFIKLALMAQIPFLSKLTTFISEEVTQYFTTLITHTLEQRKNGNIQRNDYVQQLLKLKEKGVIETQANEEEDGYLNLNGKAPSENVEITDDLLISQAFQFLSAGFDPVFLTMLYTMYELALHPEIQTRLREHVKDVLKKSNGYSYASVKEMTYLEQCIQEAMRLHPLLSFLFRVCTKQYQTEDGIVIDVGTRVVIPLNALHMDPQYHPNPEEYNPERFPPNCIKNAFNYMPFGDGPRMCIGLRYAIVEMKLGLAKIVENFSFKLSPKTKVPFEVNKQAFILISTTKLLFNMTPLS